MKAMYIEATNAEGHVRMANYGANGAPIADVTFGHEQAFYRFTKAVSGYERRLFQVPADAPPALAGGIDLGGGLRAGIVVVEEPSSLTLAGPGAVNARTMEVVPGMRRGGLPVLNPAAWVLVTALASGLPAESTIATVRRQTVHVAGLRDPLALSESPQPAAIAVVAASPPSVHIDPVRNYKAAVASPAPVVAPAAAKPALAATTEPGVFRSLEDAMSSLKAGKITLVEYRRKVIATASTPGGL